jgi:hypothetical protein
MILKIAPDPKVTVMTYEKNIMEAEVGSMELVAKKLRFHCRKWSFMIPPAHFAVLHIFL